MFSCRHPLRVPIYSNVNYFSFERSAWSFRLFRDIKISSKFCESLLYRILNVTCGYMISVSRYFCMTKNLFKNLISRENLKIFRVLIC